MNISISNYLWNKGHSTTHKNERNMSIKLIAPCIPPHSKAIFPTSLNKQPLHPCHILISSGDYHSLIFWSLLVDLRCWTPVTVQSKEPFGVSIRNAKITKNGGKRVFSLSFLDPSSPRLASGLLGPPNYFRVKEPARFGEL